MLDHKRRDRRVLDHLVQQRLWIRALQQRGTTGDASAAADPLPQLGKIKG
jgi:hypothetical protein